MSWRKGLVTHSKFRNVYGEPYRKDKCYENVRFTKNAWDGTYCAVNPKFLAVVLDTSRAGGAFLVIPLEKVQKIYQIFSKILHIRLTTGYSVEYKYMNQMFHSFSIVIHSIMSHTTTFRFSFNILTITHIRNNQLGYGVLTQKLLTYFTAGKILDTFLGKSFCLHYFICIRLKVFPNAHIYERLISLSEICHAKHNKNKACLSETKILKHNDSLEKTCQTLVNDCNFCTKNVNKYCFSRSKYKRCLLSVFPRVFQTQYQVSNEIFQAEMFKPNTASVLAGISTLAYAHVCKLVTPSIFAVKILVLRHSTLH